jgi:tetratricopeptide (TPR) repeat protein
VSDQPPTDGRKGGWLGDPKLKTVVTLGIVGVGFFGVIMAWLFIIGPTAYNEQGQPTSSPISSSITPEIPSLNGNWSIHLLNSSLPQYNASIIFNNSSGGYRISVHIGLSPYSHSFNDVGTYVYDPFLHNITLNSFVTRTNSILFMRDINQDSFVVMPLYTHYLFLFRTSSSDVSALIDKGNVLLNQSNNMQAIPYYDKVLSIDPNNTNALDDKGLALINLGNNTQAIQYYDKALAIDPNDTAALDNKGLALNNLGNYTQAIPYYDKALAIDPKDKYPLSNKGLALANLGNYTQALEYYDKALAIDPKFTSALSNKGATLDHLGSLLETSGNWTGAIKYADKALAINPNDTNASDTKTLALNGLRNTAASHH